MRKQRNFSSLIVGFMLIGVITSGPVVAGTTATLDGFLVKSFGDLKEDLDQAKQSKKKGVFIFFEQKDCPFCHRMKTTVLNQKRVQQFFSKNFLVLSVDIQQSDDIKDFQGHSTTQKKFFAKVANNRGATPVLAFFDTNGKLVTRFTGATSTVDEFMLLGQYVASKQYLKMSFNRYKREQRRNAMK